MKATLRNAVAPGIPRAMISDNSTIDYKELSSKFRVQLAVGKQPPKG